MIQTPLRLLAVNHAVFGSRRRVFAVSNSAARPRKTGLYLAQGQTAERVLIHVDTELAAKDLLNSRMAYVVVSRGADDEQVYTNDRAKLPEALGHDVSHESAHVPTIKPEQSIKPPQKEIAPVIEHGMGMGHSL